MCLKERKLKVARVADHVTAWTCALEFWTGPLQSLCLEHHSLKTALVDLPERIRRKKTEIRFMDK